MIPTLVATLSCPLVLAASAPAQAGADEGRRSLRDPAPPVVNALEPVAAPAARDFEGLRFHRAPGALSPGAVTEDSPGFLGPRRDGTSRETHLRKDFSGGGPALVWETEIGEGYSSPVLAEGRLVVTHREGEETHVDCLEPETGRRFWRRSLPCTYRGRYISNSGPRSTPFVAGGRVYVQGLQGLLVCLELATGRVVWRRDLAAELGVQEGFFGAVSSPLVHGELLIQNVGAPGGPGVAAFDRHTGRLVWGAEGEWGASCASPVVASLGGPERLFVLAGGESRPPTGGLLVLEPESGALRFRYPFRSRTYESVNGASPVVGGERVFVTASYGTGTAALGPDPEADGEGLRELWRTKRVGVQFSNPVFRDGRLYLLDGRSDRAGELVALDPATGAELSRTELSWEETVFYQGADKELSFSVGEGSLLAADGRLLCLGDNGHLLWLDASPRGVEVLARASLFRANESWTPPALHRGLLYVRQNNRERFGREPAPRRLLCFDLRAP